MSHYTAGQKIRRNDLLPGSCIARGNRATNTTAASANTGALRLDGIPITAGRVYGVHTNGLHVIASVANDAGTVRISYVEGGANAATTDPVIAAYNSRANLTTSANTNGIGPLVGRFTAATTGTVSILLFHGRLLGTGNISLLGTSFGGIDMMMFDLSDDPGDTGVDV